MSTIFNKKRNYSVTKTQRHKDLPAIWQAGKININFTGDLLGLKRLLSIILYNLGVLVTLWQDTWVIIKNDKKRFKELTFQMDEAWEKD